jgi:hypothetical protein
LAWHVTPPETTAVSLIKLIDVIDKPENEEFALSSLSLFGLVLRESMPTCGSHEVIGNQECCWGNSWGPRVIRDGRHILIKMASVGGADQISYPTGRDAVISDFDCHLNSSLGSEDNTGRHSRRHFYVGALNSTIVNELIPIDDVEGPGENSDCDSGCRLCE